MVTKKDREIVAFALALLVGLALAECACGQLTNVRVEGGAAEVKEGAEGTVVSNTGRITADVAHAPDAFVCRLEPGANPDGWFVPAAISTAVLAGAAPGGLHGPGPARLKPVNRIVLSMGLAQLPFFRLYNPE